MSGSSVPPQQNRDIHPRDQNPHFPLRPELSKDEKRVLKECSTESFWFRCVPLSIVLIGASQLGVNKGYLAGHPKYGALLKNLGAGLLGYVLGKFSYQGECRKKILALPDSKLGESIRKRQGIQIAEEMSIPEMRANRPPTDRRPVTEKPLTEVYNQMDYVDTNVTKSLEGLDDGQRPSLNNDVKPRSEIDTATAAGYSNYDDLRHRNRMGFQQKNTNDSPPRTEASQDPYNTRPWPVPVPRDMGPSGHRRPPPPPDKRQSSGSNQYGDVWDE